MIIEISDDFDLDKIIYSGQCFRPCLIEEETRKYRFITGHNVLYISIMDEKNKYDVSCDKNEWERVWKNYFDLDRDYKKIRNTIPVDDIYMNTCACDGEGIRILRQDKWEMLVSFIISQRKSIPAIRSCIEKLCLKYGTEVKTEFETIHLFPTCEQLFDADDRELAECGLGYRLPYVKDAAHKVYLADIDLDLIALQRDDELFEALINIKGVGRKVANCIMLFAYGRIGRAPVDVWISRVIEDIYNGTDPFGKYGDVAGIMQQYVFYHVQNKH